ncbi:hypothetical protein Mame01_38900 [Microbispora amethystogenes]|nr:hypothetical protein Mame01_38900 [Microbispora amethystogenes]
MDTHSLNAVCSSPVITPLASAPRMRASSRLIISCALPIPCIALACWKTVRSGTETSLSYSANMSSMIAL